MKDVISFWGTTQGGHWSMEVYLPELILRTLADQKKVIRLVARSEKPEELQAVLEFMKSRRSDLDVQMRVIANKDSITKRDQAEFKRLKKLHDKLGKMMEWVKAEIC